MALTAEIGRFTRRSSILAHVGVLTLLLSLAGCASVYFHDAGAPPVQGLRYPVAQLPFSEYWTGIVFNGDKIGYARFNIRPASTGRHEIVSEASFVLRFLGI